MFIEQQAIFLVFRADINSFRINSENAFVFMIVLFLLNFGSDKDGMIETWKSLMKSSINFWYLIVDPLAEFHELDRSLSYRRCRNLRIRPTELNTKTSPRVSQISCFPLWSKQKDIRPSLRPSSSVAQKAYFYPDTKRY